MATFLYKLGRASFRKRWIVLGIWLVAFVGVGYAGTAMASDDQPPFELPGTESQDALDLLNEKFPEAAADGGTAQLVFQTPDGSPIQGTAYEQTILDTAASLDGTPQVRQATADADGDGAVDSVSESGDVAYFEVDYTEAGYLLEEETQEALLEARDTARASGLTVEVGGDALEEEVESGTSEIIGMVVAAIVLIITFGAFVAAGLPLLNAILGVGIGISGISAATYFFDINEAAPIIASMLGIAVSIDYALFILARYRHEISEVAKLRGLADARELAPADREEAMGRAVGTAGSAVVFAGLTVIIALCGMMVINIPFLTQMGLAGGATIAVAVLIALTLLPAMGGFLKRRITPKRSLFGLRGGDPEAEGGKPRMGRRWVNGVTKRPVVALLGGVVVLGGIAAPAAGIELGFPDNGTRAEDTTERKAYDMLSDAFGPGFNGSLLVVVDGSNSSDPFAAAQSAREVVDGVDGIVLTTDPFGNGENENGSDGDTFIFQAFPSTGPADTETVDTVDAVRAAVGDSPDATVSVSGTTATVIDMSDRLLEALVPYLLVVVGLAFLLLMIVFRSLLVPLTAALGFLLSLLASLGATVAVFQEGFLGGVFGVTDPAPIMAFMPIIMIAITFGLAMDYQVFLVTRMREEYVHGAQPTKAIVEGFSHGARVVTAAAIIMISVFFGFIISDDVLVRSIGFSLAAGVFFDAFIVRMTIIPALLKLFGRGSWAIPSWLNRIIPNVDVEGEKLRKQLEDEPAEPKPELSRV